MFETPWELGGKFLQGVEFVKKHIPGFEVRYKNESWVSRLIGILAWVFNREYMTEYTTTRYPKVYFPSRKYIDENQERAFKILMHEFVHLNDRQRKGWLHVLEYSFPQVLFFLFLPLAFLSLLQSGNVRWVGFGVFLFLSVGSLLPLPAPFRTRIEMRGYAMNLAFSYWRYGTVADFVVKWVEETFTGWGYYKMWPFKEDVSRRLQKIVAMIENREIMTEDFEGGSPVPFLWVHWEFFTPLDFPSTK